MTIFSHVMMLVCVGRVAQPGIIRQIVRSVCTRHHRFLKPGTKNSDKNISSSCIKNGKRSMRFVSLNRVCDEARAVDINFCLHSTYHSTESAPAAKDKTFNSCMRQRKLDANPRRNSAVTTHTYRCRLRQRVFFDILHWRKSENLAAKHSPFELRTTRSYSLTNAVCIFSCGSGCVRSCFHQPSSCAHPNRKSESRFNSGVNLIYI